MESSLGFPKSHSAGDEVYDFGSHFYRSHQHIPLEGRTDNSSYLLAGTTKTTGNAKSEPDLSTDAANDQTGTNKYKGDHKVDTKVFTRQTGSSQVVDPAGLNNGRSSSLLESTVTTVPRVETKYTETHLAGPATSLTAADDQPHAKTGETKTLDVKREWKIEESHPNRTAGLISKTIEHSETRFEKQTDADDYHYNSDGTPVDGTTPHTVFDFGVAWTRSETKTKSTGSHPTELLVLDAWRTRPADFLVIAKSFTLDSHSYDYDEQSQYEPDGERAGHYDKSGGTHHETSSSSSRELLKVYHDGYPGLWVQSLAELFDLPDSSSSSDDAPFTEKGTHANDQGHYTGTYDGQPVSGDYGVGPGEQKATPTTLPVDGVGAAFFAGLKAGGLTILSQLPVIGRGFDDAANDAFRDIGLEGTWTQTVTQFAAGVGVEAGTAAAGGAFGKTFKVVKQAADRIDSALTVADGVREIGAGQQGRGTVQVFVGLAGARLPAEGGKAIRSGPANALGVADPPHYSGVGIGDNVPVGGTYTLRDPKTGEVMRSGRTNDLERRMQEHERDPKLKRYDFTPEHRTDDSDVRRGLEQMLHDKYKPPLDKIRPVNPRNKNRQAYEDAAKDFLNKTE